MVEVRRQSVYRQNNTVCVSVARVAARRGLLRFGDSPGGVASSPALVRRYERLLRLINALEQERTWLEEAVKASSRPSDSDGVEGSEAIELPHTPLMTIAEVAELVGVSTRTIFRAIARGDLETLRAGSGVRAGHRITDEALQQWLARGRPR